MQRKFANNKVVKDTTLTHVPCTTPKFSWNVLGHCRKGTDRPPLNMAAVQTDPPHEREMHEHEHEPPLNNERASVLSKPQQDSEKKVWTGVYSYLFQAQIISKQDDERYEDHYSALAHLAAQLLHFASLDLPNSERD